MEKTRKPRILFVNEWHQLSSGYATYGRELLTRLHAMGKYELFEFAQYADPADPAISQAPWKVYGNMPAGYKFGQANEQEKELYENLGELGSWRFEQVALDCQPDIVFSFEDWWYFAYQETSPFRHLYNWMIQPAVDAAPQLEAWISTFINADKVATYTDFGLKTLEDEGGGLIKLAGTNAPGVDLDTFKPVLNKKEHKRKVGLEDKFVVGFLSRNQPRKLFPNLIYAFGEFIKQNPQLAETTVLYLHTGFPDIAYDIPRHLKKAGVTNKVYFTYKCRACNFVQPQTYKDVRCNCPNCGQMEMFLPNVQMFVDRNTLASIYNLFDIYVQYANSEGIGLGLIEAPACGVPVMAVDYSGMGDVLKKVNGIPIRVNGFVCEHATDCLRAYPDNQDFIDKLVKFINLPESIRAKRRMETRELCVKYYDSDKNAAKWAAEFDKFPLRDWKVEPRIHTIAQGYPTEGQMPNDQFITWAFTHVLGRPDLANGFMAMSLLSELTWGFTPPPPGMKGKHNPVDRQTVINQLAQIAIKSNNWETERWQRVLDGRIQ